jgi:LytS/YehU family sensor histidine kinase
LEALRFDYHMRYSIVVDEDDIAGLSIPTLLLQPYVENAIWHGLVPKQGERTLHITISVTEQQLLIAIEDNGIGRKRAAEMKSMQAIKYQSKGMNINRDRLSMLGSRQTGAIDIEDLTNEWGEGTGTRVRIILPLAALTNRTNE